MNALELLASDLFKCLKVGQIKDIVPSFVFEILAKHLDPTKVLKIDHCSTICTVWS